MAEAMETEMDFSDGEQTQANTRVPPSAYIRTGLMDLYGNSAIGLDKEIEQQQQLPGYIFMCNAVTKPDCFRYRVFGIPRGRKDVVESIKPGMKLFLYDFEKRLLYGVYEATVGGKLDIEPEAFDRKYPAQVGFRIVKNCYPLPETAFKSAILENYRGGAKFKQELAPHQVMSLLSLFRSFPAPELDSLPDRLASRASVPRGLSFEERFIAATQLRKASSVLDPMSGRHGEPQLGSLMAHYSDTRTPLHQHSYSRQDDYTTPVREALLNQPYFPKESRQQRLPGDPSRSSIQDPQLKYLTILSNIRRYGTASERVVSENEYYPATPSEKDQTASPYSDNKYYPSTLSGNEHPSASAANGSLYRSELYTSASQKEGEASQQHEVPPGTYYHPEASTVPNSTVSMQSYMQAASVGQSRTDTAGYSTQAHGKAPQTSAGAVAYTHQPQSVASNYSTYSQPASVQEIAQSYAGVSHPQQQHYAATGHTSQLYAGGTGYSQQPQAPETGYAQQSHASETGYALQPQAAETGYTQQHQAAETGYTQQHQAAVAAYAQQLQAAATGYAQQPQAAETGYKQQHQAAAAVYAQQHQAAATGYAPQYQAAATGYAQQQQAAESGYAQQQQDAATVYAQQHHAASTVYAQQPNAQAVGYTPQYQAQAVGYTPQYQAQSGAYSQQAVTQSYIPAAPGTTDWKAASQAYADWNTMNQSYYPQSADATATYNQTS
ncbi:unnamed protein product [Cochlearia groenlandica]